MIWFMHSYGKINNIDKMEKKKLKNFVCTRLNFINSKLLLGKKNVDYYYERYIMNLIV